MDIIGQIGSFFGDTISEKLAHGRIRQRFLVNYTLAFVIALCIVLWLRFYPDTSSPVTLCGLGVFVGLSSLAALFFVNADINDQNSGRYSKFGSGWNLWGDNIFSNQLGQAILTLVVIGSFSMSIFWCTEVARGEKQSSVTIFKNSFKRFQTVPAASEHFVSKSPAVPVKPVQSQRTRHALATKQHHHHVSITPN